MPVGYGGTVKLGPTGSQVEFAVGKWKLSKKRGMAVVTTSKSGGTKKRKATSRDQMVTFELPWDSDEEPEDMGLEEGEEIEMELAHGSATKKHRSTAVIIESIDYDVDNDEDANRVVIVGYANVRFILS